VEDVQGNNVTIEDGTPIILGKISVLKIDQVLMSGGAAVTTLGGQTLSDGHCQAR